jgi:MFS family permease
VAAIPLETQMIQAQAQSPEPGLKMSHLAGLVAGNTLEFYDFTIFLFFAPQIGVTLFSSGAQSDGLLLALAAFAVGFVGRPLGAAVIGRYGDKAGRKPAMLLSFALMGGALLAIGLTPPSSVLGIWSAIIVTIARLVQGFALGGEVGPTTALLIEAAPPGRRGTYGAWQIASQGIAVLVAGLVGLVISMSLPADAVSAWGWRIAVLLGALLLPIGFYLRRVIPETLHQPSTPGEIAEQAPLRRLLIAGLILILSNTVTNYTLSYFNTYTVKTLKLDTSTAFITTAITGCCLFLFGMLGGRLSDRIGRRKVIVWPRVGLLLLIYPVFVQIALHPSLLTLAIGVFLLTSLFALSSAPANVALAEGFRREHRSLGYALTCTIAISIFGGSAQFLIAWMIKVTGNPLVPAWWLMAASLAGIVSGLAMPMIAPPARRARPLKAVAA